jgi:hypothetical protein
MQKVEGSSPFIRFKEKPRKSGLSCFRVAPGIGLSPSVVCSGSLVLHVRLVFVPLPHLLVHELFLTVLPTVLLFRCARSVIDWGLLLTLAEEALQPHLQARSYPAVSLRAGRFEQSPSSVGLLRGAAAVQSAERWVIDDNVNERVAVVGKLVPGSRERAAEILAKGAPYGLALAGFRRHSVFLAEETVVFVFEGPGIEGLVRDLVNDPARSAAFSIWAPLLEGTPVLAREEFYWEAGQQG